MKSRLHLRILVAVLSVTACAYSQDQLPSEFQSWNEVQLIVPLLKSKDRNGKTIDKITATFNGIVRVGRRNLDLVDNRAGTTLELRVNKNLTLLTALLYRKDELARNIRRYETRLDFGATVSTTWKNFTFRDRNMFEHRFRNGRADIDLYRNRIQVSYPIKRNDKELFTPFISEEGYYNLTQRVWAQNEFLAGITRRINRRATVDVAYIRNDSQPANVNGLSLTLKIKLR